MAAPSSVASALPGSGSPAGAVRGPGASLAVAVADCRLVGRLRSAALALALASGRPAWPRNGLLVEACESGYRFGC